MRLAGSVAGFNLKALLPLALALACGLALAPASHADDDVRSIQISGEAERRIAPDMALLLMEVVSESPDSAVARREADGITAAVLKVLRNHGIESPDIDSSALSIQPQYRWIKNEQRQELVSYRVSRGIDVRLLDLDKLGVVLEAVSESGINSMQPPRLGLVDEESVYREVLEAAVRNARERAAVIANALDEDLGDTLSISTHRSPVPRPMAQERMMMAAADSAAAPGSSYESGYLTYSVTLTASFALD
jgi:uncharacterized protein YggE